VLVGLSYFAANPPRDVWDDPSRGRIARYAWGADYHAAMLARLQQLAQFIRTVAGREVQQRIYVDTGPLLERDVATRAGLGFIGRNTCLISPAWGSFLFLGEILLDVELEYDEPERLGTCGACTRCLAACPTGALVAPYVLDSRRCISYLTIELKGSIPVELRPLLGNWIFGCDACQSVCPWPRRFAHTGRQDFLRFEADRCAPRLTELMQLDEAQFHARFRGMPMLRAKRRGLLRNVAVALANWGDAQAVPSLRAAAQDADPLVREHAAWALARFR
jgi:epoxyqueuosine reductase